MFVIFFFRVLKSGKVTAPAFSRKVIVFSLWPSAFSDFTLKITSVIEIAFKLVRSVLFELLLF